MTVAKAMQNRCWMRGLRRMDTDTAMRQFVDLWTKVQEIQLQPSIERVQSETSLLSPRVVPRADDSGGRNPCAAATPPLPPPPRRRRRRAARKLVCAPKEGGGEALRQEGRGRPVLARGGSSTGHGGVVAVRRGKARRGCGRGAGVVEGAGVRRRPSPNNGGDGI